MLVVNVYCIRPIIYNGARIRIQKNIQGVVNVYDINKNTRRTMSLNGLVSMVFIMLNSTRRQQVTNVSVNPYILEIINSSYTEKLIPGLGGAFPLYHMGFRPYIQWGQQTRIISTVSGNRYPLIQKYFSGDVSGNIGESLFAYIAIALYKASSILHLRPAKINMLTPDFVIFNTQDIERLSPLLCLKQLKVSMHSKLFVECKASASGQIGKKRVTRGLAQLLATIDRGDLGILFLIQRDHPDQPLNAISIPLMRR